MDIQQEIKSFLVNTLKVAPKPEHLKPDDSLIEDHGVDSAGIFEMILWLEDRFSLHIPPADLDLANFSTIRAVASYVQRSKAGASASEVLSSRSTHSGTCDARASVVVLTCGSAGTTIACLESVATGRFPGLQLVVVCNGGDGSVVAALRAFADRAITKGLDVRLLLNGVNLGACMGRNQALAQVSGEFVAFIDNDILCHDPWWLNRAVDLLRSDSTIGMVGPRIVRVGRPLSLECAGYAVDPEGQVVPLGVGQRIDDPHWQRVRIVQAVGNFVARTKTIREIGGFDVAFDPFGFENIDCSYRVKAAGYTVVCDGQSDLSHAGHVTTGSFDQGGRRILFEKSLLFRKRWRLVFEQERELFAGLMSQETPAARPEVTM